MSLQVAPDIRRLVVRVAIGITASSAMWARSQDAGLPVSQDPAPRTAAEAAPADDASSLPNIEGPTLGGKQLWTDELVFHDWRIQRHVWTGHYRLLDDQDARRAWGSFAQCRASLESCKRELQLPPLQPRVVLVLHGLGRTRQSTAGLCRYLRTHGQDAVLSMGYASTRGGLDEHAASLAKVIEHLEGVREICLVAHSLGNLVIRRYLAGAPSGEGSRRPDERIQRVVMLAPPNNGAQLAERFRTNAVFRTFWGISGQELAERWDALEQKLATPGCEFGIIAGGTGSDAGRNPLLDGDDDLIVSVAETRLAGARDFLVVPALHTVIMDDPTVQECTLRFLQEGHFRSEEERCPISSSTQVE